MIITFLRRWWFANKLHHFCKINGGIVWANEQKFIEYIESKAVERNGKYVTYPVRFPYNYLLEIKSDLLLDVKIRNAIDECSNITDGINYLIKENTNKKSIPDYHLRLSSRGQEVRGIDYLIFDIFFGNAYVKTIIISIIMILVGYYINNHIIDQRIHTNDKPKQEQSSQSYQ